MCKKCWKENFECQKIQIEAQKHMYEMEIVNQDIEKSASDYKKGQKLQT